MPKTIIIGHKKPDTDSVVAPMAFKALFEGRDCFGHQNCEVAISDPLNPETTYLFEKFNVKPPRLITAEDIGGGDTIILVDHNEASQRLDGMPESQIVEIYDHHKVNLNLSHPIFMTFKAWGSSCSIAYSLLRLHKIKISKKLASLMLAGILSDTVGFKSVTTTKQDKEFGQELAEIAQIANIDAFALEIFKAKSDISHLTDQEIVQNDYKVFDFSKKTYIAQLETVEQSKVLESKTNLLEAMNQVKTEQGAELCFVAVTDVLIVNTKLLILGEEEKVVAQRAFGGQVEDSVLDIGEKMSRKKEIAPAIEKALE